MTSFSTSPRLSALLIGLALGVLTIVAVAVFNVTRLRSDFEAEASTLHRIVSQRVDQHDAHLTGLAAVIATADVRAATLGTVVEAVRRFYPRIVEIEVVALSPEPSVAFTTRPSGRGSDLTAIADLARGLSPGQAQVVEGIGAGRYELVKRLPDRDGRAYALAITIDGRQLLELEAGLGAGVGVSLREPSRRMIVEVGSGMGAGLQMPRVAFEKALGSRSQPLILAVTRHVAPVEVLPPVLLAAALSVMAVVGFAFATVLRERRRSRRDRELAVRFEQEARLAHAMRVNTVGEMASGIAHELTQPLTAILSNSQAGLRLARTTSTDESVIGILESNARLARRAGDILQRLRAYVSRKEPAAERVEINGLVRDTLELAAVDLERRGVTVTFAPALGDLICLVDRISIEQVIHNLLRNAADAMADTATGAHRIELTTAVESGSAVLRLRDHGPGISADSLPRLFEPFFTTKPDGMGLGLSLSERLVETYGGRLTAANHPGGGAVLAMSLPLAAPADRLAAE